MREATTSQAAPRTNLHSHSRTNLDGCEGYDWHFDAQGQDAITCGFEAIVVVTSCCGELCQRCLDKPADHVHDVIERFEVAHG